MKILISLLILLLGCTSSDKKKPQNSNELILGISEHLSLNNQSIDGESQVDTLIFKDKVYLENGLFIPKGIFDSVLYSNVDIIDYRGYQFEKVASSTIVWNDSDLQLAHIFIKNHSKSYYLSTFYLEETGVIIKDHSHTKEVLSKVIMGKSDTLAINSLVKRILLDTNYFPKQSRPPLPPPSKDG